jgi:hypothetical protein
MCRFMQSIEDGWNILLCGTFLVLLSAMCSVAFSAITVSTHYISENQIHS